MESAIIETKYALDTFYFLVSGALVMWMAAGFAMLEAGLVRSKNTAEILTKNIALFAIACIMYMLMGYNIMYPSDGNGYFPALDLSFMFGGDNTAEDVLASGGETYYSGMSDFFFQVVFVATAMSIVSGAVAERMRLWSFLIFAIVMTGVIYPLQGYWKWGGGFLDADFGFQDFAGSGVVHLCGATAALAGVLLLGARKGKYGPGGQINPIPGANLPLATLGTFILWLGWFGFNGGSELKVSDIGEANAVAAVFVNTNAAAAAGVFAAAVTARGAGGLAAGLALAATFFLVALRLGGARRRAEAALRLGELAGESLRLTLRTRSPGERGHALWGAPTIEVPRRPGDPPQLLGDLRGRQGGCQVFEDFQLPVAQGFDQSNIPRMLRGPGRRTAILF